VLPPQLQRDTRWLVAQHELSLAREALQAGYRGQALRWLLSARPAMSSRRWWFTLTIVGLPRHWVHASLRWRERRSKSDPTPSADQALGTSKSLP
jgi:hypothetical protein